MQFSLSPASLESWTGSVLAVGLVESDASGLVEQLESRLELAIKPWLEQRRFKGKSGEVASLQVLKPGLSSLVFVGLGGEDRIHDLLKEMPGGPTGALIFAMLFIFVLR